MLDGVVLASSWLITRGCVDHDRLRPFLPLLSLPHPPLPRFVSLPRRASVVVDLFATNLVCNSFSVSYDTLPYYKVRTRLSLVSPSLFLRLSSLVFRVFLSVSSLFYLSSLISRLSVSRLSLRLFLSPSISRLFLL